MSGELTFTWTYEDYLAVTGRVSNDNSAERWSDIVDLVENKYDEQIDNEIRSTIDFVDSQILKEEK